MSNKHHQLQNVFLLLTVIVVMTTSKSIQVLPVSLPYQMNRFCAGTFDKTYTIMNGYGVSIGYITSSFSSFDAMSDWNEESTINNPLNAAFIYYYGQECSQIDDYIFAVPSRIYDGKLGFYGKHLLIFDLSNDMYLNLTSYESVLPVSAHGSCVVTHNDWLYVIGGQNGKNNGIYLSNTQRYHTINDSWVQAKSINIRRYRHGCASVSDIIYIFGGFNGNYLNSIEKYDTNTDSWSIISARLFLSRRLLECSDLMGFIFCIGGEFFNGLFVTPKIIEVFDVAQEIILTNQWNIYLNNARYAHNIIKLDNSIIIMGGKDDTGKYLNSVELLTPSIFPTISPTLMPSNNPSITPTNNPSSSPTESPVKDGEYVILSTDSSSNSNDNGSNGQKYGGDLSFMNMGLLFAGAVIVVVFFACLCFYMFRRKMKLSNKKQKHMSSKIAMTPQNVSMYMERIQSMSDARSDIAVGMGITTNTSTDGEIMMTPSIVPLCNIDTKIENIEHDDSNEEIYDTCLENVQSYVTPMTPTDGMIIKSNKNQQTCDESDDELYENPQENHDASSDKEQDGNMEQNVYTTRGNAIGEKHNDSLYHE